MSERLTRGLAAMIDSSRHGPSDDAVERSTRYLATPTGQALAALVEAAMTWHGHIFDAAWPVEELARLDEAVDAWLAATEETT